ncbi:Rne/Rng family ribonuclease [Dermabacter vaginalis]|uniref:Rne/Rng family ribonuclease n=1 Tax=Dermabacter vaginalis TaxID=1630135 RepID=A0ABX6A3L6_9MICO|nr:Rne/Rng family ribonuclease [Dermabacter vaginalis]QEU11796.1 Rne/Rng family ribonuclease [Dermabacter vaginalis]
MAEVDPLHESSSTEGASRPRRRTRRAAGAPAGAPKVGAEQQTQTSTAHTSVASQQSAVVSDAKPLNLRERRLAAKREEEQAHKAEAGAQASSEPGNSADASVSGATTPRAAETPTSVTSSNTTSSSNTAAENARSSAPENEAPQARNEADAGDEKPFAAPDLSSDLKALADSRQSAEGSEAASAPDMLDFASLLFQAPTPTLEPSEESSADDESEDSSDPFAEASVDITFGAPDLEAARRAAIERAERESREAARTERSAKKKHEADDESSSDAGEDSSGSESEKSGDLNGDDTQRSSRRRRRRGGRGRRGRGGKADDDSNQNGNDDEGAKEPSGNSSQAEGSGDNDDESGTSSRRRRRRRRHSGSSDEPQPDDPPNTVVKVREARDEVKAVKGSTRLEAKKQRRREGRESGRRRHSITESEFLARRESVKRTMIVRERPGRTQIVVLEDNILVEHYVAQKSHTSMVGNVYLGKVQNVLPSMEAAFVDIGRGRNAVLYAGEVNWDAAGLEGQPRRIESALKAGDPVLVQVTKDPIGHKGARLTSQISLPGRYLVYVPGGSMTGISRKLPDKERSRLKKILKSVVPAEAGVIVRTAAEGASEEELTRDVERLQKQWEKIEKASAKGKNAPTALSTEPDLAIKVVRDIFNEDFTSLIVEGENVYRELHEYISEVAPDLLERVTKHVGERDSFAKYRVDEQLMKAMDRKVYLPSGGSLVIDRTEAMTVVDVNTGKFTGTGGSLEETVTRNNLEAAEEIVRQLRLRDIGGIIVVDFIDMVLEANRDLVLRRMIECLSRDRTKHQVAEVTSLGLVQMTRKRVGAGLVETFSSMCESCNGRGIQIDLDGQHHHEPPAFDDEPKKSRRRSKKSRNAEGDSNKSRGRESKGSSSDDKTNAAKDAVQDLVDSKTASDVHRLEENEASRALARATIASIAAASTGHTAPEVVVDGQVIAPLEEQQATEPEEKPESAGATEAPSEVDNASTETEATAVDHSEKPEGE